MRALSLAAAGLVALTLHASAQQPAPIMGVSPTRPGILPCNPPVEVAAASRPDVSSATAPMVPLFFSGPGKPLSAGV